MPGRKRTGRDQRRRDLSQNFLVDGRVVRRLLRRLDLADGDLVVEFGPGKGALTLPLAEAGANVVAVERDPRWARTLREHVRDVGLSARVEVVHGDLRSVPLPTRPYRVVANVPFSLTTAILARLLDDPEAGPQRADLLVQWEVARKRASDPPTSLRSAAWAPWWEFALGERVRREAFRPVPRVDAGWLTVRKREPPVLPPWLAPRMRAALQEAWDPPPRSEAPG